MEHCKDCGQELLYADEVCRDDGLDTLCLFCYDCRKGQLGKEYLEEWPEV